MKRRSRCPANVLAASILLLGLAACQQQPDGPLPVPTGEQPGKIEDISRDLQNLARRHANARQELADDLSSLDPWIGAAFLSVGVVLLTAGLIAAGRRRERTMALLYAVPGLAYLVFWWPSLGVSRDMDLLLGAFPGAVAAAWLMSRTPRMAIIGLILLAATHVLFWSTVAYRGLERVWIT